MCCISCYLSVGSTASPVQSSPVQATLDQSRLVKVVQSVGHVQTSEDPPVCHKRSSDPLLLQLCLQDEVQYLTSRLID